MSKTGKKYRTTKMWEGKEMQTVAEKIYRFFFFNANYDSLFSEPSISIIY